MRWFLAAMASVACFCTAAFSTFVPLRDNEEIEYLFVWPGGPALVVILAAALLVLVVLFGLVLLAARHHGPEAASLAGSGRWMAPLTVLGLVALGIAPAVPGVGTRGAVMGYFFYGLRWWWFALLIGWSAWRADSLLGAPIGRRLSAVARWSPAARLLLIDGVLFAGVMAWAVATTPQLRFSGALVGDEPKYIRYCEVWYQGGGFAVSSKVLMTDQPLDAAPAVLRNFGLLPGAIAEEARALTADLGAFAADPRGFRWNRVRGANGFPIGKHGPTYQVHQAGLSFLLFPGYFIDRYLLGVAPGYQAEFPADLVMTNMMLLLMYGASAVALFRFLRNALGSDGLAAVSAGIGMLLLPMTAFAFQFYPEVPAALGIILVSNYLLFHARSAGLAAAAAAGVITGGLTWLHPRFVLLSACLTVVAVVRARGGSRRAFVAASAVVFLALAALDYRITGSWLPTALWAMPEQPAAFNLSSVPINLIAYVFHRVWGLAPHAPLLIGALAGWLVIARRQPAHAAFLAMSGFALGIPAAGHTLSAAGTTPDRLVLAVVPLFIWPLAVLVREFWTSVALRTAVALAVVLSLDQAFAYNWSAEKIFGPLRDSGLSGWRPNLAFPLIRDGGWTASSGNMLLFLSMIGLVIGLSAWAFVRSGRSTSHDRGRARPASVIASTVVVLFVGALTAATAANGRWTSNDYLLGDQAARRAAAEALVAMDRCRGCFSSLRPALDWTGLKPNPARDVNVGVGVDHRVVTVHVSLDAGGTVGGFARTLVEFGDGARTAWTGVVDQRDFTHEYRRAGQYQVSTWVRLADGRENVVRRTIDVADDKP